MDEKLLLPQQRALMARLASRPSAVAFQRAQAARLYGAKADFVAVDDPPPPPAVDHQRLFERFVREQAPFAGLYALANQARARWALDYLIQRVNSGAPLSTRLEFVPPAEPCPLHPGEVRGWCKDGTVLISMETHRRLSEALS